jgi:methylisocitrate lyase
MQKHQSLCQHRLIMGAKRCGHRPNKAIVTQEEMVDRIKAAVDARGDDC